MKAVYQVFISVGALTSGIEENEHVFGTLQILRMADCNVFAHQKNVNIGRDEVGYCNN